MTVANDIELIQNIINSDDGRIEDFLFKNPKVMRKIAGMLLDLIPNNFEF